MTEDFDPSSIADPQLRALFEVLLNRLDAALAEITSLRAENQRLRDEINRLKGEHGGRPKGGAGSKAPPTGHSSEQERRQPRNWEKRSKLDRIVIDRTELRTISRKQMPEDAEFKGYERVVIQDLVLRRDNVCFLREKWHSPSHRKTYLAPLPPGWHGQFGPGIHALCLSLAYESQVSQPLIHTFLKNARILISRGEVVFLVTGGLEPFQAEQAMVLAAGLKSSPWQHLDSTYTPVGGVSHACHVLGNPLFSIYHTTRHQDRASVLDVLRGGAPRSYRMDATASALLAEAGLPCRVQERLALLPQEQAWDEPTFTRLLEAHLPRLGREARKQIMDAAGVAAYRAADDWPVTRCLVCDDAAQFRWLTEEIALCWVHDARHYTKLVPGFACFRKALVRFRGRYWKFYRELLAYREAPSPGEAARLEARFDTLFSTETCYAALQRCIARTRGNKAKLLHVLAHPELPLHNNPAELAARRRVRKRRVSFGPRSEAGREAWDTFQSLMATTAKLGISFYDYLTDRITQSGTTPPLEDLIAEQARVLKLGMSWDSS